MSKTSGSSQTESNEPHWIEWLTGSVSAAIVICLIGWIGRDALLDRDTSPDLSAAVLKTEARGHGFQVIFEVKNSATATAADVTIVGEIRDGGSVLETAETTIRYVPGASRATGGLIFKTDPTDKSIAIRATGYSDP